MSSLGQGRQSLITQALLEALPSSPNNMLPLKNRVVECPYCGITQDLDSVWITWEESQEPRVPFATKKSIRSNIKIEYKPEPTEADEQDSLLYTCGLCDGVWDGLPGENKRVARPYAISSGLATTFNEEVNPSEREFVAGGGSFGV